jgi:hypothetical protein
MGEWVKCLDCEERFYFPDLLCLYWLGAASDEPSYRGGPWVRVLCTPIWCGACNQLSYAERVPSLREFEIATALRRQLDRGEGGAISDELLQLTPDEFTQLADGLRNRTGAGACLVCGGRVYLPLQIDNGRVRNLRHDACGGEFEHSSVIFSFVGAREIQWYELSGKRLLKQADYF